MNVAIITENKLDKELETKLEEQGAVINYKAMPEFYNSYADEIDKINHSLIRRAKIIVFKLDKYYYNTQKVIEYALFLGKQCRIDTEDKKYFIKSTNEWKYKGASSSYEHPVLIKFKESRREYYTKLELQQEARKYEKYQELKPTNITEDEMKTFVHTFARLYKLDIDYTDNDSYIDLYLNIKYYIDNDIEYCLDINEIYEIGAIAPEDTPFKNFKFKIPSPCYGDGEEVIESFGDMNYLEDVIYKEKVMM